MDLPCMTQKTFKKYEREIGPVVELVAKDSCEKAAKIEKDLTIENVSTLHYLL